MAASSVALHADPGTGAIDRDRATVSVMEELEAADWYDQSDLTTQDPELQAILTYTRDEEQAHAAMLLEWLRRHDGTLNAPLCAARCHEQPAEPRSMK